VMESSGGGIEVSILRWIWPRGLRQRRRTTCRCGCTGDLAGKPLGRARQGRKRCGCTPAEARSDSVAVSSSDSPWPELEFLVALWLLIGALIAQLLPTGRLVGHAHRRARPQFERGRRDSRGPDRCARRDCKAPSTPS
jgi:hypothetical protein